MLPTFQVYKDRAGQYRWRLLARNGQIVAVSESYTAILSAKYSAELIKALAPVATITYL